jgi:general secretion pathway protein G
MKCRKYCVACSRYGEHGYTLLELLVVILILALIIAVAAPKVVGYFGRSKTRVAEIQIANIVSALDLYRLDVGHYPSQGEGLRALVENPDNTKNWDGPYLTRKDGIIDPWGRPYGYTLATSDKVVVSSLGADGKLGGTEEDADLVSDH